MNAYDNVFAPHFRQVIQRLIVHALLQKGAGRWVKSEQRSMQRWGLNLSPEDYTAILYLDR